MKKATTLWLLLVTSCAPLLIAPSRILAEEPSHESSGRLWHRLSRLHFPDVNERNHRQVVNAFRDVVTDARSSTVRVLADDRPASLGTVVSADGFVLTKASELHGNLVCLTSDGRRLEASLVARDRDYDLALLKLSSAKLVPVSWGEESPGVGAWIVTPGIDAAPEAIGVVSAQVRQMRPTRAVLGVRLEPTQVGPRVLEVVGESAAARAAIRIGDVILQLNGQRMGSPQAVSQTIGQYRPGERVELAVRRGEDDLAITAVLGEYEKLGNEQAAIMEGLGGPLSTRRSGFPVVLQHDSVLQPRDCGGPLVDLEGQVVGINIARSSRVASYAIPASIVQELLEKLQADFVAQDSGRLQNTSANP